MATPTPKPITNEDLLRIMQELVHMTSEGLNKVDYELEKVKERLAGVESRLVDVEHRLMVVESEVKDLTQASYRHELQVNTLTEMVEAVQAEQRSMHNDFGEIYHRLGAIERRLPPQKVRPT